MLGAEHVQRIPYLGTEADARGAHTITRGPAQEVLAAFDPGGSRDVDGQRITATPSLYVDFDQQTDARDQWRVRGVLYEVVGEPAKWLHPNGWRAGQVIGLRRVVG